LPINTGLQHTQKEEGAILQNREKLQKTLNHKNPKNHTSSSSLPEQPLTVPRPKPEKTKGAPPVAAARGATRRHCSTTVPALHCS